jgi:hypothetical protein
MPKGAAARERKGIALHGEKNGATAASALHSKGAVEGASPHQSASSFTKASHGLTGTHISIPFFPPTVAGRWSQGVGGSLMSHSWMHSQSLDPILNIHSQFLRVCYDSMRMY